MSDVTHSESPVHALTPTGPPLISMNDDQLRAWHRSVTSHLPRPVTERAEAEKVEKPVKAAKKKAAPAPGPDISEYQ